MRAGPSDRRWLALFIPATMRARNCGCTTISAQPELISGDILLLSRPRYGAATK